MAQSREIEKLQRRWQENPLGLTFAPLAEAYRKEGMYADALELLDIGLAQHPNYVPAHIVRGRCHLDAGSDGQAEAAFTQVTELDPENVIALKGLAEIAERAGRYGEAADLLGRLLAFDRNNDDAKAQLERVRSALVTPSPGRIDPSPVVLEEQETDEGVPDTLAPTLEIPAPPDAPLVSSEPAEPPSVTIEPLATMESELAAESDEAALEGVGSLLDEAEPPGIDLDAPVALEADDLAADPSDPPDHDEPAPVIDLSLDVAATAPVDDASEEPSEVAETDAEADDAVEAAVVSDPPADVEVEIFHPIELSAQPAPEFEVSQEAEAPVGSETARIEAEAGLAAEEFAALSTDGPAEPVAEAATEVAASEPAEETEPAAEPGEQTEPTSDVPMAEAPEVESPGWEEPYVPAEPVGALADEAESAADETATVADQAGEPVAEAHEESEEPAGEDEAPLLVTETMAELFLKQGHQQLALAVYRQLSTRDPENARIREAIARLSGDTAESGLPTFAAARTGGRSVRTFFNDLLAAVPPDSSSAESGPALGAVFGDEPSTATAAAPPATEAGPSFDEFFGDDHPSQSGGSNEPRQSAAPTPTSNDDIEEFNSWLRGLKR